MAARTYYHASPNNLPAGTVLTPGGGRRNFGGRGNSDWVFMADTPEIAERWGNAMAQDEYVPRVYIYEVEPRGEVTEDRGYITDLETGFGEWVEEAQAEAAVIKRLVYSYNTETGEAKYAGKLAFPSWRPYQNDRTFWDEHDAVIATDQAGRRRTFEIWVDGKPFGRGQTLQEAKDRVEAKLGPLTWRMERPSREEIVHYYFGPTTEFSDPLTLYFADREA